MRHCHLMRRLLLLVLLCLVLVGLDHLFEQLQEVPRVALRLLLSSQRLRLRLQLRCDASLLLQRICGDPSDAKS